MSMRHLASIAFLACALTALCGCEPQDLIHNALIDRWCGNRPCDWDVKGKIARVGTWHEKDYAVRFVSDHAQISQLNASADASVDCYAFTMLAKVDEGTRLFLELDFLDDGKIDFSQRIPESDWDYRQFLITPPTWYHGVRFILRKDGPGYAALAQLSAQTSGDCSAPPLDLRGRPPQAPCENDEQCSNGICAYGYCGCSHDSECGDAGICGEVFGGDDAIRSCVAAGSSAFGDRCRDDAQCASGICCNHVCSTCCDDAPCPDQNECGPATSVLYDGGVPDGGSVKVLEAPMLCAPGAHVAASGEVCTGNADCASGVCMGADTMCAVPCDDCWVCLPLRVIAGTCE